MSILFIVSAILFLNMKSIANTSKSINTIKANELVEIIKLDSTIKLDIRYATKNNFLSRAVYKLSKAYLQKPVAEELISINKEVKSRGYGLLVFDGYRPWSVTKIFWDEVDPEKRQFVANPTTGSIHNRGCAVDLTLYELASGKEVKMPCEYDTFSEKAYPSYTGGTKEERKQRDFLIKVMEQHNFKVHPKEWWHFDHKDCDLYSILDVPFEEL